MATNNNCNQKTNGFLWWSNVNNELEAVTPPIPTAQGGTGSTTFTAYAVICQNANASDPLTNVSGVGTSGQVLTGTSGAGNTSLPTWQAKANFGYALNVRTTAGNPADSSTYYPPHGGSPINATATLAAAKIFLPVAGTINTVYGAFFMSGASPSNENSTLYIRKNNTTDTTITSTFKIQNATNTFSSTNLGISVSAGDYVTLKWTTPAWTTNPLNVIVCYTILVQ